MSALTPDLESAITFLDLLRSGGPWVLTAITPDGPTTTETFYKGEAAARWIERENATRNIYVMAAEATGALRKKATKDDVARTRHLWADIDSGGDLTQSAERSCAPANHDRCKWRWAQCVVGADLGDRGPDRDRGPQPLAFGQS